MNLNFIAHINIYKCIVQINLNFIADINIHKCIAKMYCTNEFEFLLLILIFINVLYK
jgi:hypothetical protein